ncbi:MAG: rod shape-determining protein MreD, partial [Alphaproteobacteria bacterium]|nr:rod shape-determining protein MreD [Alphaproteobacteria bacterium]
HAVAASPNAVPALGLCALIHWAGDRETRIPYWCAFILGLLADSLNGTPAGLYAAVFILAQAATRFLSYKLDIQHFNTRWLLAAAVILAAALVMSLGVAALSSVPRLPPSLWTYSLVTIAVYPLIAWILSLAADPRH